MNFAILGTDPDLLALAAAAVDEGHHIVWIGDVRRADENALRCLSSLPEFPATNWETLLDQATADAILIGRGNAGVELRTEQLKRFVTDAVPLLVVHPAGPNLLAYYELDMVRRETHAVLRHYNPLPANPVQSVFAQAVAVGDPKIGAIQQVVCTRHVTSGARDEVLDSLARDVELLAAVGGDVRQVSAIGPPDTDNTPGHAGPAPSFGSLQVQMTAAGKATMRWSLVPSREGRTGVELALVGDKGQLVWNQNENVLFTNDEAAPQEPGDAPRLAIRELVTAITAANGIGTASGKVSVGPGNSDISTWDRATRAMEVVDAVELSLQKGRTIEVYQQQLTEQLAFRGTMAAFGCGLLLLGLVLMFVAGIAGGADWILQRPVIGGWPIFLLAVLAFFLLLQLVPWLATRQTASRDRDNEVI